MNEFIISFRETLEAALIVGIIYTVISKQGLKKEVLQLWYAVGASIVASLLVALFLNSIKESIGNASIEKLVEATLMYITAGLLWYVIFWLAKKVSDREVLEGQTSSALKTAGWGVVEGSRIRMEFPITQGRLIGGGQRSAPSKADYVLQYRNRNLAIIEAKSDEKGYTEGVPQAKDYAERLQVRYAYSTNGKQIYGIDMFEGSEGDVQNYPTPDELWDMTFEEEDDWRDKL
ncbi:MAG TPA: hypothetical protein EYN84_04955, partial [Gammaproteobacteria bacterium]|nr:hypothetical protein [Gammaproteobacteria bacterium]